MSELRSRISYLKGLADGMDLSDSKEKRLMMEIINVLEDMAYAVEDVTQDLDDTIDYVDSIDEDLCDLEEDYYGDDKDHEDMRFYHDDDDDDFDLDELCDCDYEFCDEDFIEVRCDNCDEIFNVDESLIDEANDTTCPHCGASVELD